MDSRSRLRIDRLVLEAAALAESERTRFLDALPTDDATVTAEVRRRLRAAKAASDHFLRTPATDLLESVLLEGERDPTDERGLRAPEPPDGGERYEIGECLGAGGAAHVYRAFDRQLGRPVALKVLRDAGAGPAGRRLHEARAQARVRHDHVLDVYETGELDGRPYIAVRHVAGGTLAERAGALGVERSVGLLVQVAEGLHAAHREGLLHGDVKPSNVLVEETPDGDLHAWIGDFGIATEAVEGDGEAAVGGAVGAVGTPPYMAPELLRRDGSFADRRADVFSLGVTLYQTLTGELPPRGADRWADLRREAPDLPPDLLAIVARCLALDPEGRYPSARAVAEDLRRFLNGDVVGAYADRRAYRLTRFVARHRALLTVGGVAAVLLVVALATAALLGVRAMHANERADRRRGQAEDLISFMLLDLRDKLDEVGRLDLLDDVGERAMGYFAAVPEAELSDEELARRSTALHQIGDVRIRRGDLESAQRPLEQSLALARQLSERHPNDLERLFDLGQSEFWVGYARWKRDDLEGARRAFVAYREISERLVLQEPDNSKWLRELSYSESNLGSLLEKQGDLGGALERFRSVLALDHRLLAMATDPRTADDQRFELAATHNLIGLVLKRMGSLDAARRHFEADLALRRRLVDEDPENQRWQEFLGTSRIYLGNLLLARGDPTGARADLEGAREVFDRLVARDPANGDWRYKLAWSDLWVGRLEQAEGRDDAARTAWLRAESVAEDLARIDPERTEWHQLLGVARLHVAIARAREAPLAARQELVQALRVLEPWAAERSSDRRARRWLAEALLLEGDLDAADGGGPAAETSWRRARETLAPLMGGDEQDPDLLAPWRRALARLGPSDARSRGG